MASFKYLKIDFLYFSYIFKIRMDLFNIIIKYDVIIKKILHNSNNISNILCSKNDETIIDNTEINFLCRLPESRLYYYYKAENACDLWIEYNLIQINSSLIQFNAILNLIKLYIIKYDTHDDDLYDLISSSNNLKNFIDFIRLIYVKLSTQICHFKKMNNENYVYCIEMGLPIQFFNIDIHDYSSLLKLEIIFKNIHDKFNIIIQYIEKI